MNINTHTCCSFARKETGYYLSWQQIVVLMRGEAIIGSMEEKCIGLHTVQEKRRKENCFNSNRV